MQAAGGACLDAGGFQPHRHAVIAQRALEDFARWRVEFRNVERATGHAIPATDAVRFLKIDDTVSVLDDRGIRRSGREAARIGAVHALVLAHQQHQGAVFALVLVEFDQVPIIPCSLGHRLITIVEGGFTERITIPFETCHFASFATDTRGGVH